MKITEIESKKGSGRIIAQGIRKKNGNANRMGKKM